MRDDEWQAAYNAGAGDARCVVCGKIEAEARRYANMYAPHSDGWNTFVIFADYVNDVMTGAR